MPAAADRLTLPAGEHPFVADDALLQIDSLNVPSTFRRMPQLSIKDLTFTYARPNLLDGVTLHVEHGERIGLVGRNGAGKSTLLKIIAGHLHPDDGAVVIESGVVVAELTQEVPDSEDCTAFQVAARAFGPVAESVAVHRSLNTKLAIGDRLSDREQSAYDKASELIADTDLWTAGDQLEGLLREMQLPPDADYNTLSAGMKRRVLLARAMIQQPGILLLDEPTNHLDIDSILWLQGFLQRFSGTLIFVTHDREFLQQLANRIIEVDRGKLFDWTCDYQTFLKRRDDLLAAEAQENAHFDRRLAEEEKWIRKGIKARRTRNEGRVRALKKMRQERSERRQAVGSAKLKIQEAERSGRLVAELKNVTHGFEKEPLINNFDLTVFRGDRIGIIGPNGIGKSTLVRILLGQLNPNSGNVRLGTNLAIAYFDQLRGQLDPTLSARDCVSDQKDFLLINGNKRHVIGYLQDFLFSPERANTRVEFLSGGERNRLLLAKILAEPANVLVLDEPTNDLDVETLELLEETLPLFNGTLLLISHDRAFLNNIVTSTVVFEGDGVVREYDGGYDDWLRQRSAPSPVTDRAERVPAASVSSKQTPVAVKRKLTFGERRELEALPLRIEQLEQRQQELHRQMTSPTFYQSSGEEIAAAKAELERVEAALEVCFSRWEELED